MKQILFLLLLPATIFAQSHSTLIELCEIDTPIEYILLVTKDEIFIEGDTAKAIYELWRKLINEGELISASDDILKYVSLEGNITNPTRFNEAVGRYLRLKEEFGE